MNKRGINETLLKVSRSFYLAYPQVKNYLQGKTPEKIDCPEKSATPSHQFEIPADKLISQLSFSYIREMLTVDDPLARFFYELECIKCCWSVKELRRQIATNLYFRSGMSKKPELLLKRTQTRNEPAMTIKDPFSFEFLDLRPELLTRENEMREGDNPPVGILLCTKKGKKMVDYALTGLDNKLFVSSYMLSLPDKWSDYFAQTTGTSFF